MQEAAVSMFHVATDALKFVFSSTDLFSLGNIGHKNSGAISARKGPEIALKKVKCNYCKSRSRCVITHVVQDYVLDYKKMRQSYFF